MPKEESKSDYDEDNLTRVRLVDRRFERREDCLLVLPDLSMIYIYRKKV